MTTTPARYRVVLYVDNRRHSRAIPQPASTLPMARHLRDHHSGAGGKFEPVIEVITPEGWERYE